MMEWGQAKNFIWLWAPAVLAGLFFLSGWRKKSRMRRFGEIELVQRLTSSLNPAMRLAKWFLLTAAAALLVLALCQPHFKKKETLVEQKGIDVVIAVDVSRSMLAKDTAPTRLGKAKLELSGLIDRLRQDRIGIVAFAGEAFIQCPLTLDRSAVKLFLSSLSPDLIDTPGTAIGKAVRAAVTAFSDRDEGSKALILLTDGEDHEGDPMAEAKRAKAAGITIFTVGIGTPAGSTLPGESGGAKKDRRGEVVMSRLNEPLLKGIAKETGGVYYRSSRGELEIESLVSEIRKMGQKGLQSRWQAEYEESYQWLLVLAFVLLLVEWALPERRRVE